jgi:hypothetical protein
LSGAISAAGLERQQHERGSAREAAWAQQRRQGPRSISKAADEAEQLDRGTVVIVVGMFRLNMFIIVLRPQTLQRALIIELPEAYMSLGLSQAIELAALSQQASMIRSFAGSDLIKNDGEHL